MFRYTFIGPSPLTVNVMKNINTSSIVVQWDAVDDFLTTSYAITWTRAGVGLQVATLTEQTSYTITGLTLDTVYTISVSAANICGSGPEFSTSIILSTNTISTTSSIVIASTNPMSLSMPTLISSSTATTTALTTATNSTIITVMALSSSITPTQTHMTRINPITTTTTTTTTATTTATTTSTSTIIVNDTAIAATTTTTTVMNPATTTNPTNSADVTSMFKHNSYIYCDIIHAIGTSLNSNK